MRLHGGVRIWIEEAHRVTACALGLIHRGIGTLEQLIYRGRFSREEADADAGCAVVLVRSQLKRHVDGRSNFLSNQIGLNCRALPLLAEIGKHDDKLIASLPGDGVICADAGLQSPRYLDQKLVPDIMP